MSTVSSDRRRWIALALLAMAQFVVVLDASIVNVALPSIGRGLHFSQDSLSWVVNAYVLTFGGFLLLGGRMADLIGRRKMFIAGLIVFALASLAGGLAQSEGWLIAARAVQGLGAAILSPAALSIVTTTFAEGADRNRALGVWGAVAGSGGAAGVLLGGILTSGLGWQWVLFVNTPIGLLAALLAPRLIDESRAEVESRSFDVAGAVTVTAGLSILVYALVDAQHAGWGSFQTIGLLAVAVLLLGAFALIESRASAPLVPFRIFRQQTVLGANVTGLLIGASLFSMFFFISLYMQQVLGYGALKAGISYLPLAGSIVISAGVASQLVTKIGFKPVLLTGLALIAIGLVWFGQISADGSFASDILGPSLGRGSRPRVCVRAGHDRRGGRCQGPRPGARQRSHQHLPAGRRGTGPGRPGDDRQLADGEPAERFARRPRSRQGSAHLGLPVGLLDRCRVRDSRAAARVPADPSRGLPSSRRGGRRRERGLTRASALPGRSAHRDAPVGHCAGLRTYPTWSHAWMSRYRRWIATRGLPVVHYLLHLRAAPRLVPEHPSRTPNSG